MEITHDAVILPKLRETNSRRVSAVIGEKGPVSVKVAEPAQPFQSPNAAASFSDRDFREIHASMNEAGKIASTLELPVKNTMTL